MILSRTFLWRKLRERKILAAHKRTAKICEDLLTRYQAAPEHFDLTPKKQFDSERIIWQYWAQGYDDVPPVVRECLDSVERFAAGCTIVRLSDANLAEYLDLPDFVQQKRDVFSRAFFSDLLRLMLLKTYGGLWLDATIFLSAPIPEAYWSYPFFVFRRDRHEPYVAYWRNTFAYYFGWAKGFRVNMLSSFMAAKKGSVTASELCGAMLLWWKEHEDLPDYFFLQILFDVYPQKEPFPLVSDTLPHYLQQTKSDPSFNLMDKDEILRTIPIHKLTYK